MRVTATFGAMADPDPLVLGAHGVGAADFVAVARHDRRVTLGADARAAIERGAAVVDRLVERPEPVYGVSTGFGLLANTAVDPADLEELQRRIVLSHATGTGDPLEVEVVRAMQLLRARTLTQGYSGVPEQPSREFGVE